MSKSPLKLSHGERMFIARRRNRDTQENAAACALVSRMQYQRAELDVDPSTVPAPRGVTPTVLEELVVRRRRAKMSQDEVARAMGLSRQWINKMELGKVEPSRLIAFWERHERGAARRRSRRD